MGGRAARKRSRPAEYLRQCTVDIAPKCDFQEDSGVECGAGITYYSPGRDDCPDKGRTSRPRCKNWGNGSADVLKCSASCRLTEVVDCAYKPADWPSIQQGSAGVFVRLDIKLESQKSLPS
jgi:hypothetical protein